MQTDEPLNAVTLNPSGVRPPVLIWVDTPTPKPRILKHKSVPASPSITSRVWNDPSPPHLLTNLKPTWSAAPRPHRPGLQGQLQRCPHPLARAPPGHRRRPRQLQPRPLPRRPSLPETVPLTRRKGGAGGQAARQDLPVFRVRGQSLRPLLGPHLVQGHRPPRGRTRGARWPRASQTARGP